MFQHTIPMAPSTQFSPTEAFADSVPDGSAFADLDLESHSTLSASLLADLRRFGEEGDTTDLLPALAASVRHGKALALTLRRGSGLVRLSVFPRAQLFHCTVDLCALPGDELAQLQLVHVEPEVALSPLPMEGAPVNPTQFAPLPPLLWLMAEYGAHTELLPEIAGRVRYRMAPGFSPRDLPIEPSAMPLLQRLRSTTSSLQDLVEWTVRGPSRVSRLLNALYLQAGLMVLRVSPKSTVPAWPQE